MACLSEVGLQQGFAALDVPGVHVGIGAAAGLSSPHVLQLAQQSRCLVKVLPVSAGTALRSQSHAYQHVRLAQQSRCLMKVLSVSGRTALSCQTQDCFKVQLIQYSKRLVEYHRGEHWHMSAVMLLHGDASLVYLLYA